jgi:hypothetical protein
MRPPILSRERPKTRIFRAPGFCLLWTARHARQTGMHAVARFLGMTASIGFGRISVRVRLSRLRCETRETSPTAVLSRCLSLPLGERHARQTGCVASLWNIQPEVKRD